MGDGSRKALGDAEARTEKARRHKGTEARRGGRCAAWVWRDGGVRGEGSGEQFRTLPNKTEQFFGVRRGGLADNSSHFQPKADTFWGRDEGTEGRRGRRCADGRS